MKVCPAPTHYDRWLDLDPVTLSNLDGAVPRSLRPAWVANVVAARLDAVPDLAVDRRVALNFLTAITRDEARWSQAREAFERLRSLSLRDDQSASLDPAALVLRIGESAAKVIYNASGQPAPHDRTAGVTLLRTAAVLSKELTPSRADSLWRAITLSPRLPLAGSG